MQGWMGDVPPQLDLTLVDAIEPIEDEASLVMTERLAREEGSSPASRPARTSWRARLAERLGPSRDRHARRRLRLQVHDDGAVRPR